MFKNYYYSEIHLFEYPSCSKYILQQLVSTINQSYDFDNKPNYYPK